MRTKIQRMPEVFNNEWTFDRLDDATLIGPGEFTVGVLCEDGGGFVLPPASVHELTLNGLGRFQLEVPEGVVVVWSSRSQALPVTDSNFAEPYDRQPVSPELRAVMKMQRENAELRRELLERFRKLDAKA